MLEKKKCLNYLHYLHYSSEQHLQKHVLKKWHFNWGGLFFEEDFWSLWKDDLTLKMTSKQSTELSVVWLSFRSCAEFGPLQVPSWGGELLLLRADPGQSDFNNVGTQPSVPKQINLQPDPQPSLGVPHSCEQPKPLSSCSQGQTMEAGRGTVLNLPMADPHQQALKASAWAFLMETIISTLKLHPLGL